MSLASDLAACRRRTALQTRIHLKIFVEIGISSYIDCGSGRLSPQVLALAAAIRPPPADRPDAPRDASGRPRPRRTAAGGPRATPHPAA